MNTDPTTDVTIDYDTTNGSSLAAAPKPKKASGKTTKDVYEAEATFTGVWLAPEYPSICIVGLDVPDSFAPELVDPDRINGASEGLILSIAAHGVKKPIRVGRFTGKLTPDGENVTLSCVIDGRQRVMGAREANSRLKSKGADFTVSVPAMPDKDTNDPLTTLVVANENFREDTPFAKARKAKRLRDFGKSREDICIAFGVKPSTLDNWDALLNLAPAIAKAVEKGTVPTSLAYDLGKMPKAQQEVALEALVAAGPLQGAAVRENARNIRTGKKDKDGETKAVSGKLAASTMKALLEEFAPIDDAKKGDVWDGDGCEMTFRLLEVILGKDPTAKGLRDWPDVHSAVAKVLRAAKRGAASE